MHAFFHFRSIMADYTDSIVAVSAGFLLLSATGVIPKVGLIRSLTLGFRKIFNTIESLSARTAEIKQLNNAIKYLSKGRYIVVTGGRGMASRV
jgi:hypothetical protein